MEKILYVLKSKVNNLYTNPTRYLKKDIEVLFDDRIEVNAGEKFADADLIGIPYRVVVSKRSLSEGGYEIKKRIEDGGKIVSKEQLLGELKNV